MPLTTFEQRAAAALASYESRTIDVDELHRRLLLITRISPPDAALLDLLSAVDEASDLGRDEQAEVAWAASTYWRSVASRA